MNCETMIADVLESASEPLFLWQIQQAIRERFGVMHETTAISARIREQVKEIMLHRNMVVKSKAPKGKKAHQYWAVSL